MQPGANVWERVRVQGGPPWGVQSFAEAVPVWLSWLEAVSESHSELPSRSAQAEGVVLRNQRVRISTQPGHRGSELRALGRSKQDGSLKAEAP